MAGAVEGRPGADEDIRLQPQPGAAVFLAFHQEQPGGGAGPAADKGQPLGLQPVFPEGGQHLGQPFGAVAEGQLAPVPQQPEGAVTDIRQGAAALVAGGGPGRVGAGRSGGEIGRVAGRQIVVPRLLRVGGPGPQIGADRADVADFLVGGRLGQQGAGLGLKLQGQTGAPVALVVPFQGHHPAARTQIGGSLAAPRQGEPGQKQGVGAEPVDRGAIDGGPIIQNFS